MVLENRPVESNPEDELARLYRIEEVSTKLFIAVWRGTIQGWIPDRGPVPDAALELRDALNPDWPNDDQWLPEPLASEREAGYPDIK
ncbi:MAG: hypothetical protein WDN66_05765 [Candidatus Saccharibacteria bacterium]